MDGILYYNYGTSCLTRLVVSIHSLRKHYKGEVLIIEDGTYKNDILKKIEDDPDLNVKINLNGFSGEIEKNHYYLFKCKIHQFSPFDNSIFIDADTIIEDNISDIFKMAAENEFVATHFSNWKTSDKIICERISKWKDILPRDIEKAINFGPAINTGVFGFSKKSSLMETWFYVAKRGRNLFIPDEISCQLIIPDFPHKICDWTYNASCRYDNCRLPEVKIIHYHGKKHCREGLPFHGDIWFNEYKETLEKNIAGIKEWGSECDEKLKLFEKSFYSHKN